jgi:predicted permease
LQRLLPQVPVAYPGRLTADAIAATKMRAEVQPLRDVVVGNVSRVLWIVLGAVGMLLLVACTNVANLFLARAEGRHREIAIRRALGAGRMSLLHTSLAEAIVLSAAGGALGIGMAAAGVGLLHRIPAGAGIPRMGDVHIDAIVVAFTAVITIAVALAVSVVPAVHAGSDSLSSLIGAEGRTSTGNRFRHGVRRALVVSQVALALVLVSGAALFARSFQRLSAVNPGFEAEHAMAFRLNLPAAAYPTTAVAASAVAGILRAVRALPGVESAGVATRLPLDGEATADSAVFVEDHPLSPGQIPDVDPMVFATPDYFGAMAIPLVAGRLFSAPDPSMDPAHAPREVIVNDAFARRYWTTTAAVGKRIRMNRGDPWSTIVGVVGSTRDAGLEKAAPAIVYNQLVTTAANGSPWTPRDVAFVIRVNGHAADLAASARSAVRSIAPALPVYRVIALRTLLTDAEARTTFTVLLLGIAAVMALIIGTTGIYGVVTFLVALRTREIGLRLALGAQPGDVRWMIVRRALGDATIGVIVGLIGAVMLTRELSRVLFSVSPTDAMSLLSASALLLLTALAASWLPARRAARLDPAITLRDE